MPASNRPPGAPTDAVRPPNHAEGRHGRQAHGVREALGSLGLESCQRRARWAVRHAPVLRTDPQIHNAE